MPKLAENASLSGLPHHQVGVARATAIWSQLEPLLNELWTARAAPRRDHDRIPQAPGIYLFTENGNAMYVGQTRKLRDRLRNHTIPSGSQEQASFAFLLAKKAARERGLTVAGTRKAVANHSDFRDEFKKAKERVANMDVRFIEMAEPDLRTIFEVYAALVLGTGEFNSFETH